MSLDTSDNELKTTEQVILEMIEQDGDAFLIGYLKSGLLSSAADSLFYARRNAKLSQEDLAGRMGKKQAQITRWETNKEGAISLRNYTEVAFALGMVPRLSLVPFDQAKQETIEALEDEIEWQKLFNSPESQKFLDCEVAKIRDEVARGECEEGGFGLEGIDDEVSGD